MNEGSPNTLKPNILLIFLPVTTMHIPKARKSGNAPNMDTFMGIAFVMAAL